MEIKGVKIRGVHLLPLVVLLCLLVWGAHWALTCWGTTGSFTYQCFGTAVEFGWGHDSNLMWLGKGRRVIFEYRATLDGSCDLTYYVVRYSGLRLRPNASFEIKNAGVGDLIFTAKDSGLYGLRLISRQPWTGTLKVSWRPAGR
jgi:hypothetical protein